MWRLGQGALLGTGGGPRRNCAVAASPRGDADGDEDESSSRCEPYQDRGEFRAWFCGFLSDCRDGNCHKPRGNLASVVASRAPASRSSCGISHSPPPISVQVPPWFL